MSRFDEIVNGYKNLLKSKLGISEEKDEEIFKARRTSDWTEWRRLFRE